VESVLRAIRLLGCFHPGDQSLPLSEFVRRAGYPKTTTHRLLETLEEAGWLERDEASAFRLTFRLFEIGSILVEDLDVRRESLPAMRVLSEQCGLSVQLVVPSGPRAVCIERVDGGQAVRVLDLEVGASQPLHQAGAARALLAHDEAVLLPELLHGGLANEISSTVPSAERLIAELADTRHRGYSISEPATTSGLAAIGVPVFNRSGRAIAGLSISGPRGQVVLPQTELIAKLRLAATEISGRLGWQRNRHEHDGAA
jgi:DNA-binding IclR family transcriptional regulator